MRLSRIAFALAAATTFGSTSLPAQKMLVRQPSAYLGYGYGNSYWNEFTGIFNSAFGASNINQVNAIGSGALAGYSALMLTLPNLPDSPYVLSASEASEITTFLNGGGRMYVFGENDAWTAWNTSIANLVGGTVGGSYSGIALPNFSTGILQGVGSVNYPAGGAFTSLGTSGLSLFNTNVAALFGPTNNALFILDVNLCDDSNIGSAGNRQFCRNIGGFLNGTIPPVATAAPEPATFALFGGGLSLIGLAARRRRRATA